MTVHANVHDHFKGADVPHSECEGFRYGQISDCGVAFGLVFHGIFIIIDVRTRDSASPGQSG